MARRRITATDQSQVDKLCNLIPLPRLGERACNKTNQQLADYHRRMQIRATSRPRKIYGGIAETHLPISITMTPRDSRDADVSFKRSQRGSFLARLVFRFASSNRPARVNCAMEFLACRDAGVCEREHQWEHRNFNKVF